MSSLEYKGTEHYSSEEKIGKEKSAYHKKLRGAIYKHNQENSLVGKLKKQIRSKTSTLLGKKSE